MEVGNEEERTSVTDDLSGLRRKTYKNLVVVSLGFLFTFTAFQALQNLQSSIHSDPQLGLGSLISIYVALVLSCMFIPPLVIGKLGAKYTIMVSMGGYVLYTLSMFYPRYGTLIPVSLILGIKLYLHARHENLPNTVLYGSVYGVLLNHIWKQYFHIQLYMVSYSVVFHSVVVA